MARGRRADAGPGWLTTLLGAALLLVVGFGVGLVGGAALEDPGLVLRAVISKGATVALGAPGEVRSDEAPASSTAAPTAPARTAATAPPERPLGASSVASPPPPAVGRAPAAAASAAGAPAAGAPASGPRPRSGWAVQIGAFADRAAARALEERLRAGHVRAYLAEGAPSDAARWRVRVGPFATRARADEEAARLQDAHRLPTWVLAEEGS